MAVLKPSVRLLALIPLFLVMSAVFLDFVLLDFFGRVARDHCVERLSLLHRAGERRFKHGVEIISRMRARQLCEHVP